MERVPGESRPFRKIFSQLPDRIGLVNGTKKSVEEYLEANPSITPPDRRHVYPESAAIVSALLAPRPERPVVRNMRKVGDERVRDPATQPRVYGIQHLFPIIANLLRPESRPGDHETVHLQLGIGADSLLDPKLPPHLNISPALPAYIILGLERLKELTNVTDRVRLRVFSTGSLIARLNRKDPEQIRVVQVAQKELIDAFIREFYPDLVPLVDTEDITAEIPRVGRATYTAVRDRVMSRLSPALMTTLEGSGKRYGCTKMEDTVRYAVNHCLPATFRDGAPELGEKYQISVGGYSEDPFMAIRGFNDPNDPQCRLGIVARGVLARTPPYLNRPREGVLAEVTMTEFLNESSERAKRFLEAPHSDRAPSSKDIIHVGRSIGGSTHEKEKEGIHRLQRFYQKLYNQSRCL